MGDGVCSMFRLNYDAYAFYYSILARGDMAPVGVPKFKEFNIY